MAGNVRALTINELEYFLNRFVIELKNDYIVVMTKSLNRKVIHDSNVGFQLSTDLRKINITKKAIDLWIKKYIDKYSLIEVQNAINTLIVTSQNVTEKAIYSQLKKIKSKLNNKKER